MLDMKHIKIAILGATGHIAKNLIVGFSSSENHQLYLFARSQERLRSFLEQNDVLDRVITCGYEDFNQNNSYDVIINCVGLGNPQDLLLNPFNLFQITEQYDNMILRYIQESPSTLYINLSSGAAYGSDFERPVITDSLVSLDINHLSVKDYYGISKINMEAKHRSLDKFKIIDLRIFGFFSPFIELNSKFLITDIIEHIRAQKTLTTSPENIIRDYTHPTDFLNLVELCFRDEVINDVYDVYSLKPISKFELLEHFSNEHGLRFKVIEEAKNVSVTGSKANYYSLNNKAFNLGYEPHYTSLQSVQDGYDQIKKRIKNENN